MPRALDLMYNTFIEIQANVDKFLDEDFIMEIFEPLYTELPELETYLTFCFEEKEANVVGLRKRDDRVISIDGAVAEPFCPGRMENKQSTPTCRALAVRLATHGITECIHPKKAIHDHLLAIHGKKSWIETTEEEKKASQGLKANKDAAKENFACFSESFHSGGCIRHDHSAGEGQSRYNNDYGRMSTKFVSGRKSNKTTHLSTVGLFHELPTELQDTLVLTRKR